MSDLFGRITDIVLHGIEVVVVIVSDVLGGGETRWRDEDVGML